MRPKDKLVARIHLAGDVNDPAPLALPAPLAGSGTIETLPALAA